MLDKLVIKFPSRSTNDEIDVDLNFVINGEILFDFNEYECVSIELDSDIYSVKIECISCLENGTYKAMDDNILNMQRGKEYTISKNDNYDIGYRPSRYHILINNSIREYDCFFEVKYNHQVTIDGMNNIIESINDFISGLTIDFFKGQPINGIITKNNNNDFYAYEILYKHHSRLSLICDNIINDLKMSISNKIVAGSYTKKQNIASIRKNSIKNYTTIYSVKKVLNANNVNNIILKKYLIKIKMIIENFQFNLVPIISSKDEFISQTLEKVEKEEQKLAKKNAHFNVLIIENHIKSLRSDLDFTKKWYDKLIEWNKSYETASFSIRKLLNVSEMKNLDINNQISYSPDFNMNYDYKFIADLYEMLSSNNIFSEKRNLKGIFSNKKSLEIFEIFGFVLLQNIIKEVGFKYVGKEQNTIFDFTSGSEFEYIYNNKKIIIKYDYYCNKYTNAGVGSVVNINSKNCKPDYLILFFEDDDLKNITVVEMKYRNLKHLVEYDGGSTETDITLEDYSQLGYLRQLRKKPELLVKDVLLIYPSREEVCFERNLANYIGINPEIEFNESKAYKKIKKILFDIIEE